MDEHAALDIRYHALIAEKYDYITNEPRRYPNELLFKPIDSRIKPARTMLDLGCGTGQMILRYHDQVERIIAVDHSREMMAVAKRKAKSKGVENITFCELDVHQFLELNRGMKAGLITCVGVIHHLEQEEMETFMSGMKSLLAPGGQCVVAEPIYSDSVPKFISHWNEKSILPKRLAEAMPPQAEDPDEEPLREEMLLEAVRKAGFSISVRSKGFELFHVTEPITYAEKLLIRMVYGIFRNRGDVIALLIE